MAKKKTFAERIENAYEACIADRNTANSRALSWEHCIAQFASVFEDLNGGKIKADDISPEKIDYLSLHLGFYLASWGMMRNSKLMDFDYKIHAPLVQKLMNYHDLFRKDFEDLFKNKKEKFNEMYKVVEEHCKRFRKPNKSEARPSTTLVSKIIMGTFGITPAYDDFVTKTLREYKIASGTFGVKSLQELSEHFSANFKNEVDGLLRKLQKADKSADSESKYYTRAKVIDMLLWNVGKEIAKERDEAKKKNKE